MDSDAADLFPLSLCRQLTDSSERLATQSLQSLRTLRAAREVNVLLESKALVLDEDADGQLVMLGSGHCSGISRSLSAGTAAARVDLGGAAKSCREGGASHAAKSIASDTNIMLGLTRIIELFPGTESVPT